MPPKKKKPDNPNARTSFALSLPKAHRAFLRRQAAATAERAGRPISVAEYVRRDIEAQMASEAMAAGRSEAVRSTFGKAG